MTHCPKCNANRETYPDCGPGETWERCSKCGHILKRVRIKTAAAFRQRTVAHDIIHKSYNLHEGTR